MAAPYIFYTRTVLHTDVTEEDFGKALGNKEFARLLYAHDMVVFDAAPYKNTWIHLLLQEYLDNPEDYCEEDADLTILRYLSECGGRAIITHGTDKGWCHVFQHPATKAVTVFTSTDDTHVFLDAYPSWEAFMAEFTAPVGSEDFDRMAEPDDDKQRWSLAQRCHFVDRHMPGRFGHPTFINDLLFRN